MKTNSRNRVVKACTAFGCTKTVSQGRDYCSKEHAPFGALSDENEESILKKTLHVMFGPHIHELRPDEHQNKRIQSLNGIALRFCLHVVDLMPEGSERLAVLQKVREASALAVSAITLEGKL